ncbi:MAG: DUF4097 domain-containing protein [Lachnospiraceae bacterium]|nr:DUF4097 domain-containing protein [Lachnospiraceae bacterium]
MKKAAKIVLAAGAASAVLGSVLCVTAGSMIYKNIDLYNANRHLTKIEYTAPEEITAIRTNLSADDIDIVTGDVENVEMIYWEIEDNEKYNVKVNDGVLSISRNEDFRVKWELSLPGFTNERKISIVVPEDSDIEYSLKGSSGSIKMSDVSTSSDLNVEATSGFISLDNVSSEGAVVCEMTSGLSDLKSISCNSLSYKASSGELKVSDVECSDEINLEQTSGMMIANNLNCNSLKAKGSSGEMILKNVESKDINIEGTSGDIQLTLPDSKENYNATFNMTSGFCNQDSISNPDAEKNLNIRMTSGNINVKYGKE